MPDSWTQHLDAGRILYFFCPLSTVAIHSQQQLFTAKGLIVAADKQVNLVPVLAF